MAATNVEMYDSDASSSLSESLDPETLEVRSMVPGDYHELATPSDGKVNTFWVYLVTPERKRLSDDVIEASEYLKAW